METWEIVQNSILKANKFVASGNTRELTQAYIRMQTNGTWILPFRDNSSQYPIPRPIENVQRFEFKTNSSIE